MKVFLVSVDGYGWYIKAASVRVAIARGFNAYARKFPRAMTVKRISEHLDRGIDFNVLVKLASQAEVEEQEARAKEAQG